MFFVAMAVVLEIKKKREEFIARPVTGVILIEKAPAFDKYKGLRHPLIFVIHVAIKIIVFSILYCASSSMCLSTMPIMFHKLTLHLVRIYRVPDSFKATDAPIDAFIQFCNHQRVQSKIGAAPLSLCRSDQTFLVVQGVQLEYSGDIYLMREEKQANSLQTFSQPGLFFTHQFQRGPLLHMEVQVIW